MVTKKVSIVLAPICAIMEIRDRIKNKADELFCRYGIRSITMDEIATQLGISKKTIYQYFADKDELVDAIIEDTLSFSREKCLTDKQQAVDAPHEIIRALDFMEEMFRNMNAMMLYDLERYHPRAYKKFIDFKNKFLLQTIRENLEWGIRDGLYRSEIDVELLSRFRLEGMMIAFNQELFPTSRYNLAHVHTSIIEHFLFGVASPKGYKLIQKYIEERSKKAKDYETLSGKAK